MSTTFHATFDGKVLHPEEDVDLKPNTRYVVIIEGEEKESKTSGEEEEYPPTFLAENHDYYTHGQPKNRDLP